ncbi:MAG: serine hydrolase [Gemmatimonadota bacterium]
MARRVASTGRILAPAALFLFVAAGCARQAQVAPATTAAGAPATGELGAVYVPPPGRWERRDPQALGVDPGRLAEAVRIAERGEADAMPRDLEAALTARLGQDPYGEIVGPMRPRGPAAGLIVKDGYIVAEWGDARRVDMTFSVTKSYLATLAGVALDRGLLRGLDERIGASVVPERFASEQNSPITWRMLLQQRSEWEGELWGKPDVADRRAGRDRALREPGSFWEYNDVRVNLAALALLHVWQRPLPEVLRERVMDPIGASPTWQWHGYRTSWTEVAGRRVQSVSGGGHWGGGLWISARDHARFGLLHLRRGLWGERRVLSRAWIDAATTPTAIRPVYGMMWWLNTDRGLYPSAPESSFFALGGGDNVIWVDPDHRLVAVLRWIGRSQTDAFIERVVAAVERDS